MKHTDQHPTRNEDEYFVKENAELIKQMRAKLDADREEAERAQQHTMKCPRDGAKLQEKRFADVAIDICPTCNGMWFDAGEAELFARTQAAKKSGSSFIDDFTSLFGRRK